MRYLFVLGGALLLVLPGCRRNEGLTPVTGQVFYRGRPR
jgi:hypothetical protein